MCAICPTKANTTNPANTLVPQLTSEISSASLEKTTIEHQESDKKAFQLATSLSKSNLSSPYEVLPSKTVVRVNEME